MAKTKGTIASQEKPKLLRAIIDVLFPHHPTSQWPPAPYAANEGEEVARVTNEELAELVKSFASNKAPGAVNGWAWRTVKSGVIDQKGEIDHRITRFYLFVMEHKYQCKRQ